MDVAHQEMIVALGGLMDRFPKMRHEPVRGWAELEIAGAS